MYRELGGLCLAFLRNDLAFVSKLRYLLVVGLGFGVVQCGTYVLFWPQDALPPLTFLCRGLVSAPSSVSRGDAGTCRVPEGCGQRDTVAAGRDTG